MKIVLFTIYLKIRLILICKLGDAEIYSSLARIEAMLKNEISVADLLENYLKREKQNEEQLIKSVTDYKTTIIGASNANLDNPVHVYAVLKNVTSQWKDIEKFNNSKTKEVFNEIFTMRAMSLIEMPDEMDLHMTRVSLLKMQTVYDLNPADIVVGKLEGAPRSGTYLDAVDCYKLALLSVADKDYFSALLWMQETYKLLKRNPANNNPENLKIDMMKLYSFCLFQQENVERALKVLEDILEIDPTNVGVHQTADYYKSILNVNQFADIETMPPLKNDKQNFDPVYDKYKLLCQNKFIKARGKKKFNLYCYYKKDLPYLRLAPIKVEIMHINPDIRLFRNVISDNEIEVLKHLATERLFRAPVVVDLKGNYDTSVLRTSQTSFLLPDEDTVTTVEKRIEDMTNLDKSSSEYLQVMSYGIGGYYYLHTDFFDKAVSESEKTEHPNDRIATVLLYLSSPKAGGATVFYKLNLTLYATKNDAIFWYNLKANGRPDHATLHSGCPVITGSKWIANKWFREKGQTFRRPCDLNKKK